MEGKLSIEKFEIISSEIPQKILIQTYDQVIKDLEKVGKTDMRLDMEQDLFFSNSDQLYQWILNFIKQLFNEDLEKLWQFIYIVDIPEILLRELPEISQAERIDRISKLVFLREYQKVELRKRFS